jgi:O-antigen/teichoic acid export membrane protein
MGFWRELLRNSSAMWGSLVVRTLLAFVFTPFITSHLGSGRYGLWVIIFQTLNYFSMLDVGMPRALLRFVSRFRGSGEIDDMNRMLNTATLLYGVAGLLVLLLAPFVGRMVFAGVPSIEPISADEAQLAFLIAGAYMAIKFWLWPFAGSLGAFQRYDVSNGLEVAEEIVRAILMVIALLNGQTLVVLAAIIFGVSFLRQLAAIIWLRRIEPRVKFDLQMANRGTAHSLLGYASISFGITIAWLVLFNTDSILLGFLIGPAAAGVFAPAAQMMLYLRLGCDAVGAPLMPAISALESQGRHELIRRAYLRVSALMAFVSVFLCAGVVMYAHPFVRLWLAPEFAASGSSMVVLAAGSAIYLPHIIGNSLLFGIGKHRYLLGVLAVEGALKLILSFILIPKYGIIGMALATSVPQVVIYTTLFPWVIGRALSVSVKNIVLTLLGYGLAALVVTVAAALAMRGLLGVSGWGTLLANVGVVTLAAIATGWYLALQEAERQSVVAWVRSLVSRG